MKVQFVESCVGDRFVFSRGETVDTLVSDVADVAALESFLRDQVKAGHAVELEGGARKERAVKNEAVEKR